MVWSRKKTRIAHEFGLTLIQSCETLLLSPFSFVAFQMCQIFNVCNGAVVVAAAFACCRVLILTYDAPVDQLICT